MANKLYAMEQLTEEVAKDIAAKPEEWMRFLDTASRLYKYTFDEQLLIFAQRPEATAVASMTSIILWFTTISLQRPLTSYDRVAWLP